MADRKNVDPHLEPEGVQTVVYSTVEGHDIKLDYWLPSSRKGTSSLPVIVYLHGGGMVAGNRKCEKMVWLYYQSKRDALTLESHVDKINQFFTEHCQEKGYIFVNADYRLAYPSNTFDIIDDMKELFSYLSREDGLKSELPGGVSVDGRRIAVAGCSGGGYPARVAALYAEPRPAVFVSIYGMAGDFLSSTWVQPASEVSNTRRLDTKAVSEMMANPPAVVSEDDDPSVSTRVALLLSWRSEGTSLDHFYRHPGLGAMLAALSYEKRAEAIPSDLRRAFPQLNITSDHPASVFVHGAEDSAVLLEESEVHAAQLEEKGVEVEMVIVPDASHMLLSDWPPNANTRLSKEAPDAYGRSLTFVDRVFKEVA